jgi:hypothetical protein
MTTIHDTPEKVNLHLSHDTWRLLGFLTACRKTRRDNHTLQFDGSFFISNAMIMKELAIKERTLQYAKRRLEAASLIKYMTPRGRGKATHYWILDTTPKNGQETSPSAQERPPLDPESVRAEAKLRGKAPTIETRIRQGYPREEIEACFEA